AGQAAPADRCAACFSEAHACLDCVLQEAALNTSTYCVNRSGAGLLAASAGHSGGESVLEGVITGMDVILKSFECIHTGSIFPCGQLEVAKVRGLAVLTNNSCTFATANAVFACGELAISAAIPASSLG